MAGPSRVLIPMVALLTVSVFAGCLGGSDGTDGAGPTLPFDREAFSFPATYYFDDDWGLSERAPLGDTRQQALGNFYTRWAQGNGFPEWASAPLADAIVVNGNVTLDFWVTTDKIVTSTPGIFPDFVVYFGTTESVLAVVSPNNLQPLPGLTGLPSGVGDNTVILAGDAVLVRAVFELPPGGVTVPSGLGLRVVTAPVMMENEASDLYVLYGSEQYPSQVRFNRTFLNTDPANLTRAPAAKTDHTLPGGSFLHGQEVEGVNILTVTQTVDDTTHGLLVDLDFTGSTPFPDMDLYVFAPDGTAFGQSVTPGSDEAVHLYRKNLQIGGTGDWTIKVVNYVTPAATFTLSVTTLGPSAP